jgi:hypothetical protein
MSYLSRSWSVLVWAHAGIEEVGDTIDRMLNSHADAFIFPSLSRRDRPSYHVCYSPRYAAQARRIGGGYLVTKLQLRNRHPKLQLRVFR